MKEELLEIQNWILTNTSLLLFEVRNVLHKDANIEDAMKFIINAVREKIELIKQGPN